jgi:hypothetical protein
MRHSTELAIACSPRGIRPGLNPYCGPAGLGSRGRRTGLLNIFGAGGADQSHCDKSDGNDCTKSRIHLQPAVRTRLVFREALVELAIYHGTGSPHPITSIDMIRPPSFMRDQAFRFV